jgi:hypothetical protein
MYVGAIIRTITMNLKLLLLTTLFWAKNQEWLAVNESRNIFRWWAIATVDATESNIIMA